MISNFRGFFQYFCICFRWSAGFIQNGRRCLVRHWGTSKNHGSGRLEQSDYMKDIPGSITEPDTKLNTWTWHCRNDFQSTILFTFWHVITKSVIVGDKMRNHKKHIRSLYNDSWCHSIGRFFFSTACRSHFAILCVSYFYCSRIHGY